EDIFCTLSRNVTGTVSDARSGRAVAAYVFTNENTLTFTDAQGDFDLVVVGASNLILDALGPGLESAGAVTVGPVDFFDITPPVALTVQPAGLVFFSGFE
ncbi:MAG: hypothetical protein AAGA23_23325, partial [Pseudomonadota bacterium]